MVDKYDSSYIESLITKIIEQDFYGVAAEMAFWFILGLVPFLLFLTSLGRQQEA